MYTHAVLAVVSIVCFLLAFNLAVRVNARRLLPRTTSERVENVLSLFCCEGYVFGLFFSLLCAFVLSSLILTLGSDFSRETQTNVIKREPLTPIYDAQTNQVYFVSTCLGVSVVKTANEFLEFGYPYSDDELEIIEEDRANAVLLTYQKRWVCESDTARNWYCVDQLEDEAQLFYQVLIPPDTLNTCLLDKIDFSN